MAEWVLVIIAIAGYQTGGVHIAHIPKFKTLEACEWAAVRVRAEDKYNRTVCVER